jgi:hypothetical protein
MKKTTEHFLVYAKQFFTSGEQDLEVSGTMPRMQATLKFHDAVEYCIRAIVEEHNINHDRNSDLMPLIKIVNQFFSDRHLPYSSQIDFLNNTRGKIKHHASVPSSDDTQRCYIHSKHFLDAVTRDYLGIEFDAISGFMLIEHTAIRKYLQNAESKRKDGEFLEALIFIKKAFYVARPEKEIFTGEDISRSGFFLTSGDRKDRDLSEFVQLIVNKLNDMDNKLASLMMGVEITKSRRFEQITPVFSFTHGGCHILWDDKLEPTNELVAEALSYVVEMILFWQEKGVLAKRPVIESMADYSPKKLKEIRTEDWYYFREPN